MAASPTSWAPLVGVLAGVAAGTAVGFSPLLAVGGTLALALLLGVLVRPDWATVGIIGLVYSNAAVVATTQGVSGIVGRLPFLLLLIPFIYHVVVRHERIVWMAPTTWAALFGIAYFLSALFSQTMADTVTYLVTFATEGFALFLLVTNTIRSPSVLRLCVIAMVLAGAFMGSVALFQFVTGEFWRHFHGFGQVSDPYLLDGPPSPVSDATDPGTYRVAGPIGESNFFALVLVTLLPWSAYLLLTAKRRLIKAAWAGAGSLIATGVALTYSRGAIIAVLVVVTGLAVFGVLPRKSIFILAGAAALVLAFIPSVGARVSTITGATSTTNSTDAAVRGRSSEILAAANVYADHPMLGVGPGQFPVYYQGYAGDVGGGVHTGEGGRQAHNLLAGLAAETGTVGLVTFLGLVGSIARGLVVLRRRRRWRSAATASLASILLLLVTSMFLQMAYLRYMWLHFAIAAAVLAVARREGRDGSDQPGVAQPAGDLVAVRA